MQNPFSDNARQYLARFKEIFAAMVREMTDAKLTQSISHNFIVQMIPHHRAAIRLCENLLHHTANPLLQRVAENGIAEQTGRIADMERICRMCSQTTDPQPLVAAYQTRAGHIVQAMFQGMENACQSNAIDANFLRKMLPLYRGGVRMGENLLQYTACPALESIAEAMIASQRRSIWEMERLLGGMR